MYASAAASKRARVQSLATQLYSQRRFELMRIARTNAPSRADAEEALQEAFVSFITHFDPNGPAPALPWLILTLKRACWAKRNPNRDRCLSLDAALEDEDSGCCLAEITSRQAEAEPGERIDRNLDARQGLAALKPDERSALLLLGLGYSYREIAELCGWTYTKVNRCISEGRAALRRS
jgi:RNA polymerase sigma factor (sigma-70 family)